MDYDMMDYTFDYPFLSVASFIYETQWRHLENEIVQTYWTSCFIEP